MKTTMCIITVVELRGESPSFLLAFRLGSPKPASDSWPFSKHLLPLSFPAVCFFIICCHIALAILQHPLSTYYISNTIHYSSKPPLTPSTSTFTWCGGKNPQSSRHILLLSQVVFEIIWYDFIILHFL